ncbi:nudC domain-containing protein 2-like isoform X2 [Ischnura elegans]|uniref:nudC domain-containing protein 2-like isoform X2 n=1 Tax=Ischnura elegans TaxID=197161 RepID=UPI001ED8894C|nr:nudC domain-containing protein 2-like isoform X2 [Ischnura elegans]
MPLDDLSHFDEKSGIVPCATPWGRWWQTVQEVNIEVTIPLGTRSKDIKVKLVSNEIECTVLNQLIFKGKLFGVVRSDEMIWTIEDGNKLWIVLSKIPQKRKDEVWEALLMDNYAADPYTFHEMRKKMDLEWFQIENPGFDFSKAKLSKAYDRLPGMPFPSQINEELEDSEASASTKEERSKAKGEWL